MGWTRGRPDVPVASPRPHILEYLHSFNHVPNNPFSLTNIHLTDRNEVCAQLLYRNRPYRHSYMDSALNMRRLCTILAEDLRDVAGRSVFFDIRRGQLVCVT